MWHVRLCSVLSHICGCVGVLRFVKMDCCGGAAGPVQVSHSAELRKAPTSHQVLFFGMLYLGAIAMSIIGAFEHAHEDGHAGHGH
jgi:hypothetical protein